MSQSYVSPRFNAIDLNGRPLVGERLYTYVNTTTTPAVTYQDAAGLAANTNPIILDDRGEAVIFLQDGVKYTWVLKTAADVLVWSQDDISGSAGGTTGGITVVNSLPSSDIGVVYLAGQGLFYWSSGGYVSDFQGGFGNGPFSHRNKIINGDFRIAERGTSFTITSATTQPYTLNQWRANVAGTASVTVTQQAAGSDFGQNRVGGFTCRLTSNAAATPGAADKNVFEQRLEGQNLLALALGTLWGGKFTIGFWVKASIAGTYSLAFLNGGSPGWRAYVANFTIANAGAWEFKTVTVPIDASGIANWNRTNGIGMRVVFDLGSGTNAEGAMNTWLSTETTRSTGSVRLVGTNAATLEIGNVQLEVGSVSSPFIERPISDEVDACVRYLEVQASDTTFTPFATLQAISTTTAQGFLRYSPKRAAPSISVGGNTSFGVTTVGGGNVGASGVAFAQISKSLAAVSVTVASGLVAGNASILQSNAISSSFIISAEL
ncbi:hypothetical protein LMG26685_02164 [Achromobacter mucicolens]|uniref:hypothetical protein n=1 Tax=Achromobacter mucicolens TaxID=1389922 RepID=UPI000B920FAF|nr:hypothetical protein [Achromobacter mucicolens]OXC91360.1 hypothetical protein BMR85_009615 [Achromobacter sp. KAs 3-5]CAB3643491.1 hypothetical protein LMG26685_02164 [Achromobacter mucicolens]